LFEFCEAVTHFCSVKEQETLFILCCLGIDYNLEQNMTYLSMLDGVPVPTAWRVLGLLMEERPPDMEVK
jgi:hypothetical protein